MSLSEHMYGLHVLVCVRVRGAFNKKKRPPKGARWTKDCWLCQLRRSGPKYTKQTKPAKKEAAAAEAAAEEVEEEVMVVGAEEEEEKKQEPEHEGQEEEANVAEEAAEEECMVASAVATAGGAFLLSAVLWGAPLARGAPTAADCDYFVVTRLPTRLDENYALLTRSPSGGFRELRGSSV